MLPRIAAYAYQFGDEIIAIQNIEKTVLCPIIKMTFNSFYICALIKINHPVSAKISVF